MSGRAGKPQHAESLDPYAAFCAAVHDLAEEPTPRNARRYLAASKLLTRADSRRPKQRALKAQPSEIPAGR